MWYLVIPPIIVVLSLSFLLWYLSRKGTDPVIAEMISQSEGEKPSFSRTKELFLRILEKWAQRFKVASLRTHNSLHEFTQSVKESRRKMNGNVLSETEHVFPVEVVVKTIEKSTAVTPNEHKEGFFSRLKQRVIKEVKPQQEVSLNEELSQMESNPITFRRQEEKEQNGFFEKKEIVPRPMVSETVAQPESRRGRMKPNISREETLIARIAVNPKDFTSYEELGDYYLEIENIKDAKECYRQVLKLSPVHRMVKIKIRRLEKLLTREGE